LVQVGIVCLGSMKAHTPIFDNVLNKISNMRLELHPSTKLQERNFNQKCTYSLPTVAITFNSIAIGVGKQFISNVVLHGGLSPKYSAHKRL